MYNSQEIADKIKTTASANGAKLGDMFSELGISPNTLHNMKTSMPKTDTLAKIADYLDVSVDYLLGREEKTLTVGRRNRLQGAVIIKKAPDTEVKSYTTDSPVRDAIIDKVKELDDAQLDRLLGYLEALTEG